MHNLSIISNSFHRACGYDNVTVELYFDDCPALSRVRDSILGERWCSITEIASM